MRKFLSFILCLITVFSVLSFAGCKDGNAVGKSWQIEVFGNDAQTITQKVGFKVTRNSSKIKDVWINVASVEGASATINFSKYQKNTETDDDIYSKGEALEGGDIVISAEQVKTANKTAKGWIKLNSKDWELNSDNVLLTIKEGRLTIREVVFVSAKDAQLTAKVDVAYVVIKTDKKANPIVSQFTESDLTKYEETSIYGLPTFLLDDQEAFKNR